MPLVEYSDSEDSDSSTRKGKAIQSRGTKRKRESEKESSLPPLPDTFHDLYASTTRVSNQDDPTLHAGRQRVTPHVEGNWPTHIYIEWHPSTEQSSRLNDSLTSVSQATGLSENECYSLLRSDLGAELPLHISLSRPITLLTHQRQFFTDALTNNITKSNLRPFSASALSFDWVPNDEKTRWFLVIRLTRAPHDELNMLLRTSNQIAQSFGQPPLYTKPQPPTYEGHPKRRKATNTSKKNPSTYPPTHSSQQSPSIEVNNVDMSSNFHISIAWTLNPPSQTLIDHVHHQSPEIQDMKIDVRAIKAKIGNQITSIPLTSKIDSSNHIIE